jgi:uncharacterized protein (DUF2235 family)
MPKNIVVCLDGTGNQVRASRNTNVLLLYGMLDLSDPSRQIAYYDPGVGTFSSPGAWTPLARSLSRVFGLAFGGGLRQNLGEAYSFLVRTYEPGDRIYLFGFSRGAYNARGLAGLLRLAGVFRPGAENLVQYVVSAYTKRTMNNDDWNRLHTFAGVFGRDIDGRRTVPIEFMGLWDTVKAAGFLRWRVTWPFTRRLTNVRTVRHAVSLDEYRRPYREYLVLKDPKDSLPSSLEEVWFAGVHSDVGGTFEPPSWLSRITLKWMAGEAVAAGLLVRPKAYERVLVLDPGSHLGTVHRMGWIWALLTFRRRPVPAGARVHQSVRERMATDARYGRQIPPDATWSDPQWRATGPAKRSPRGRSSRAIQP